MAFIQFTESARRVFARSEAEATKRRHGAVTPVHLLLALLDEPDTIGAEVLRRVADDREALRAAVGDELDRLPPAAGVERPPYDAGSESVVAGGRQEAGRLGHMFTGTEHLVISLAARGGRAAELLAEHGATEPAIASTVRAILGMSAS